MCNVYNLTYIFVIYYSEPPFWSGFVTSKHWPLMLTIELPVPSKGFSSFIILSRPLCLSDIIDLREMNWSKTWIKKGE